jgi:hypothetical protein
MKFMTWTVVSMLMTMHMLACSSVRASEGYMGEQLPTVANSCQ